MRNIMDFTFAAIDIGITEEDKKILLEELLSIPDEYYYDERFRGCRILPIFHGGGRRGRSKDDQTVVNYSDIDKYIPRSKRIFEEKMLYWMGPIGRLNLLRTAPNFGLNVHMDSTFDEIGTRQHKYRLVLNGKIDKLYFLDAGGNKIYVPDCYDSYVLDGSHPHSLDPSTEEKITLCIGKPWDGEPTEAYQQFVDNALFKMTVSRPSHIEENWVDPYFRYTTRDS